MLNSPISNEPYIKKQINDLKPGDMILHPLYRSDGLLLIDKNKILDEALIQVVQKHVRSSTPILIAAPIDMQEASSHSDSNDVEFNNDLKFHFKEYQSNTGNFFDDNLMDIDYTLTGSPFVKQLITCPYWILLENKLESERVKKRCQQVKKEFIELINNNPIFDNAYTIMKSYDDIILIHSINNVCTSLTIGLTLELNKEELIDLAIAALFINIGFTTLPKGDFKIYQKSQEYNHPVMKKHLEIFSNVTTEAPQLRKKSIIQGILDHHEYYSGLGYPHQKCGEDISLFGRILHIAHSYDGMVGGYNYTTGILPIEAFHIIYENKELRYDPKILEIFLQRTTYFKLEEIVHLPNGNMGKIIGFDNYIKHPDRPIVELEDGSKINLMTMPDLTL